MCRRRHRNRPPPTKAEKIAERSLAVLGCVALVCASPLILTYYAFEGAHNSAAYKQFKRKRAAKPPKPVRRKRALSIYSSDDSSNKRKSQLMAEQTQSGFFKLPYELRIAIYEEVVGRDEIHILMLDGRLCSYPCLGPGAHGCGRLVPPRHCWINPFHPQIAIPQKFHRPGIGVIGFLQSCRRVYTEMISVLYSEPRFLFNDSLSFLAFAGTILPERYNTVRSVHVDQCCIKHLWPFQTFNSYASYTRIRHFKFRGSPFPKPCKNPQDMSLFSLSCEVLCGMKALKDLRLDLRIHNLNYRYDVGAKEAQEATINDINAVLAMLDGRNFRTLDITFDALLPKAAGWFELPFVQLRQPQC